MCALARPAGPSGSGCFGGNHLADVYDWHMNTFRKMDQCEWNDGEMDYQVVYLPRSEKDMSRYGAGFDHPCEWYEYCRKCGKPCVIKFLDATRIEPIGIVWKCRGVQCDVCRGEVWRVGSELYSALFLRQVPTGVYKVREISSLSSRSKLCVVRSRVVKQCLWCKSRMVNYGPRWDWMVCEGCKNSLEGLVKGWLSAELSLPSVIIDRIVGLVFD